MGGRFAHPDDDEDTPGNQVFAAQYADKDLLLTFETRDWYTNTEAGHGRSNIRSSTTTTSSA